ncbi:MAG: YceI family protein [Actinomycetota bacterium]
MSTTTTTLPTGTWVLDPSTTITVTATKLGFLKVPATLALTSGTVEIDDQHQVTGVSVTADAGSYASPNDKRNEHVRSADFLAADDHPTIRFEAGTCRPSGSGYTADGSATVKGTTTPLAVTISDVTVTDGTASFTATATIDRTAVGVDKMPSFIIGRQLDLVVNASATRQA